MKRWRLLALPVAIAAVAAILGLRASLAAGFECALGEKVSADLGDGVIMYSCSWEKTPGTRVRTGPLRLLKNSVLILTLDTDRYGRLQGDYGSWDDHGGLIESGQYLDGLREGEWRSADAQGHIRVILYRNGLPRPR